MNQVMPGVYIDDPFEKRGPLEAVEDLQVSESMEHVWGERFRGWQRLKTFKKTELVVLQKGHKQVHQPINYQFKICTYVFKFIMPKRLEFHKGVSAEGKIEYGVIQYTDDERLLGVFRFPQTETGFFSPPLPAEEIKKNIINFSGEQLKDLIQKKKVLTFEAFRVPFFSFEYFSISKQDFEEIDKLVPEDISSSVRSTYENTLNGYLSDVKSNIEKLPNNLLITQNVLDLKYADEKEISTMTGNIVHFGI